jgi:hypothetical protein
MTADLSRQPALASAMPAPAAGYSLVLPPGWRRIPLGAGTDRAIRGVVREALASAPPDAPADKVGRGRLELERRLTEMARRARGQGGVDLYLPAGPVYQAPVAASFLVSERSAGLADPASVAASIAAADHTWQPVTLDGADGLRVERTASPASGESAEVASRHVDYVLPVPGRPGRWLVIAFSTLGGGDPGDDIARLLTELFDAIMSTFGWQ